MLDWKDAGTIYWTGRMPALYTRLEGYRHYILDWKDAGRYILDWKDTLLKWYQLCK